MRILATSDLDPMDSDISQFYDNLKEQKEPDLILFAGDMYQFRQLKRYKELAKFIDKLGWKCPIVAVPGNREFDEDWSKIKENTGNRITFLYDEALVLEIKGKKVGIIGSRGILDQPTVWQMGNVVGIVDEYKQRIELLKDLLKKMKCDIKIILTHYSTTFKTLEGESDRLYSLLGSNKLEEAMIKNKVTMAVHGHAHYGTPRATVEGIPIYNVAFPLNDGVVIIDTDKLPKEKA